MNGSIYAFVALALVMIFRATHLINLAQGQMAMMSTYVAWELTETGSSMWLAVLVTIVASFLAGMFCGCHLPT